VIVGTLLLLLASPVADDVDAYVEQRSRSGYDAPTMGGPSSVGAQLEEDDAAKEPLFRLPRIDRALKPWFDWKARLKRDHGLQFGLNYTALFEGVSESGGDQFAAGAVFELLLTWTAIGRETKNAGSFVFKLENRHRLGTDLSPFDLGFEAGSIVPLAVKFNDFGWGITNLFWNQRLLDGRMTVVAGRIDVTDFLDVYALVNPLTSFHNFSFSTNPTIAVPDQGLGFVVGGLLSDNWYLQGAIANANGSPTTSTLEDFFREHEFFSYVEVGYTSAPDRIYLDNLHVTVWHSDARAGAGSPEAWGVVFSAAWYVDDTWLPFLRIGWSDGGASLLEGMVSAGVGYRWKTHDVFGAGVSWGRPAAGGLRDQYTAEFFYRFYVTENLFIAPDLQLILDPALAPGTEFLAALGIKMRLTF
jgi:porin